MMEIWNELVIDQNENKLFYLLMFLARAQAYQKSGGDSTMNYYLNQKKTLEINPRHPLIKDLLRRIEDSTDDKTAVVCLFYF
jgi:HSP90 family molecular chaperone